MIHLINGIAEPWFRYMASATLQATLLALFVLGLLQIGRRWRPALRYAIMMLALCKFVIPPTLSLPTGLFSRIPPEQLVESSAPLHYAQPVVRSIFSTVVTAPRDPGRSLPNSPLPTPMLTTNGKLLLLHLAGALLLLTLAAVQKVRLRRLVSQSIEVKDPVLAEAYGALCRSMKLSRRPQLLISRINHAPIAFGQWKPVVMLPEALIAALPLSEILIVLGHELAHHRRRDLWISWVQVILSAIWWFNPVYWLLSRSIRGVREDCCDDMVLASGLASREDYCRTLLKALRTALKHKTVLPADFAYLGESQPLRRRFKRIMSAKFIRAPKLAITGMLSIIALALVLLPGFKPRIIALNPEGGKTAFRDAKQSNLKQYKNADIGIMFEYPEDLQLDEKVLNTKPKKYQITLKDETHKAYLFIENFNREDTVWPTPSGDESKAAVVTFGANSGVEVRKDLYRNTYLPAGPLTERDETLYGYFAPIERTSSGEPTYAIDILTYEKSELSITIRTTDPDLNSLAELLKRFDEIAKSVRDISPIAKTPTPVSSPASKYSQTSTSLSGNVSFKFSDTCSGGNCGWIIAYQKRNEGEYIEFQGPTQVLKIYENLEPDYALDAFTSEKISVKIAGTKYAATKYTSNTYGNSFIDIKIKEKPYKLYIQYGDAAGAGFKGYAQKNDGKTNFEETVRPIVEMLETLKYK
jgi:beta-lactamase regulating signal transducer with metallopeptidase domain